MTWLKRILIGIVGLLVIGIIGFNLFKTQIAERVFHRAIDQNAGVDRSAALPDGLHVYLCGTGSPMPDATRAGPCLGVLAGDQAFVFDVGSGGVRNLGSMGFPIARLESVYLTHLHSDHIDGLGELLMMSWIGGSRSTPTPVRGPVGTAEVVGGFNAAYRLDSTYRIAHHGTEVANPNGFGGPRRKSSFRLVRVDSLLCLKKVSSKLPPFASSTLLLSQRLDTASTIKTGRSQSVAIRFISRASSLRRKALT